MRHATIGQADVPQRSEMVHVIVEAHAGRWRRAVVDRNQQFELQLQLALAVGNDLAAATEERIVGHVHFDGQLQRPGQRLAAFHPQLAEGNDLLGRPQAHVLALPEQLHARGLQRRLMPIAVRQHVDHLAGVGQRPALCHHGVDRIAGGGRQHHAGELLLVAPVLLVLDAGQQTAVGAVVAAEAVDGAGQLREALQVFAGLEILLAHGRRKAQDFGALVGANPRDGQVQAIGDAFEQRAAAVQPLHAGFNQQAGGQQFFEVRWISRGHGRGGRHFSRAATLGDVGQCVRIHRWLLRNGRPAAGWPYWSGCDRY